MSYFESSPTSAYSQPRRRRRIWLEILLLGGFLLCLLVGLVALWLFWSLYNSRPTADLATDPLRTVQTAQIAPALALMHLAGDPADALAYQALHANQLETSRALLTFTPPTDGPARLALLLQLARRYSEQAQPAAAAQIYRLTRAITIVDLSLPALARGQALVQITQGFLTSAAPAAALDTAWQARFVAEQAPDLLPAQRGQLFEALRPLLGQVDAPELTQELAELARNPYLTPQGGAFTTTIAVAGVAPPLEPRVTTATATRQQRARELANRINFSGGIDIEPEQVALAQALHEEDQVRSDFLRQTLLSDLPLEQKLWLRQDQRSWLLLKLQVALQGYGISLAPDWEAEQELILRELRVTSAELDNLLNAINKREADLTRQAALNRAVLHWLVLQSELGLYPNAAVTELDRRLRTAETTLQQGGQISSLRIGYDENGVPAGFRILPPAASRN